MYSDLTSEGVNAEYERNFDTDEADFPSQVSQMFDVPRYLTMEETKAVCQEEFKRLYAQQIQQIQQNTLANGRTANESKTLIIALGNKKTWSAKVKAARTHVQRKLRAKMTTLTSNYARQLENGENNVEVYVFDFAKGWEDDCNSKVINQAVALTVIDIKKTSGNNKLEFDGQEITMDDLRTLARQSFSHWKYKNKTIAEPAGRDQLDQKKTTHRRWQRNCSESKRLRRGLEKAKQRYGVDVPEELIDPGCLSDTKSDIDPSEVQDSEITSGMVNPTADDVEGIRSSILQVRRKAHRNRMERALGNKVKIQPKTKIFETIKKTFRSELYNLMLKEFDTLANEADMEEDGGNTSMRAHVVSFNKVDARAPIRARKVFPFQIDELWKLEDSERAAKIRLSRTNPTEFINAFKTYHGITDDD